MTHQLSLHVSEFTLGQKPLFQQFNLTFQRGKTTALCGASGVGKSTLLKMLSGEIQSSAVRVCLDGEPFDFTQVAYMAQQDLLMPWLSVINNVLIGHRLRGTVRADVKAKAHGLLQQVGLAEVAHLRPESLSGGMRQRVALVRTLMEDKPVILMDEPFSALDIQLRFELQSLAARLFVDKTVVLVTHDPKEAVTLAHQVVVLQGKPVQTPFSADIASAPPRALLSESVIHYEQLLVQQLLGRAS